MRALFRLPVIVLLFTTVSCTVGVELECTRTGDLCGVGRRCMALGPGSKLECVLVPSDDGGLRRDGGIAADGGGASDGGDGGGSLGDGGAMIDGGNAIDGGNPIDGGTGVDGGALGDGGSLADGGSLFDGGSVSDGGTNADGGVANDGGVVAIDGGVVANDGGVVTIDGGGVGVDGGVVATDAGITPLDGGLAQTSPCSRPVPTVAAPTCVATTATSVYSILCSDCDASADGGFPCLPNGGNLDSDLVVDGTSGDVTLTPGCYTFNDVRVASGSRLNIRGRNTRPTVILARGAIKIDGVVSATGSGFAAGAGPGAGDSGSGGGHGGAGGDGTNTLRGATYDEPCTPQLAGSGGSTPLAAVVGGAGGGAFALLAGTSITLDGIVSSDGTTPLASVTAGGGAGGSIIVVAPAIDGAGAVTAKGGDPGTNTNTSGGGGGGRIRFAGDFSGFSGTIDARGGGAKGARGRGRPGSFAAESFPALWTIRGGFALMHRGYAFEGLELSDGDAEVWLRSAPGANPYTSFIDAQHITVGAGNRLSADGEGFAGGAGAGAGTGDQYGGGGAYGGAGGNGSRGVGGSAYGSADAPHLPGSGGAGTRGGAGGGPLNVCVRDTLVNDGIISSDGESRGNHEGSSGGAGGSVYIETTHLLGGGSFSAKGGIKSTVTTGADFAGSGGGGRIKVVISGSGSVSGRCDVSPGSVGSGATAGTARCN